MLVVHPSVPATDVKSLIELVKANPGKYTYGSSGVGSILHLCGEQFKTMAGGLDITHVPYRGSAPMMNDLIGGQISMAFDATPSAGPQVESGTIRALGGGMAERLRTMPNLPTMQEQGLKGFECYTWNAILAPAGTPQPIVDRLNDAISKAMDDPAVFKRLQEAGVDPTPGRAPKRPPRSCKAELAKWAPIIKASGAQVDSIRTTLLRRRPAGSPPHAFTIHCAVMPAALMTGSHLIISAWMNLANSSGVEPTTSSPSPSSR